jgi:hypothetical protein
MLCRLVWSAYLKFLEIPFRIRLTIAGYYIRLIGRYKI